jgi:hypothetical protein
MSSKEHIFEELEKLSCAAIKHFKGIIAPGFCLRDDDKTGGEANEDIFKNFTMEYRQLRNKIPRKNNK